jgi:hypothetical protein
MSLMVKCDRSPVGWVSYFDPTLPQITTLSGILLAVNTYWANYDRLMQFGSIDLKSSYSWNVPSTSFTPCHLPKVDRSFKI